MQAYQENIPKFSNPNEELEHLRGRVATMEKELLTGNEKISKEDVIGKTIAEHKKNGPNIQTPEYRMAENETNAIVLNLKPEIHDRKMDELLNIIQERGILNAISVVEKMNNPHVEDDFARFLIQYIKAGLPIIGINEKSSFWKGLHMTLYEVSMPDFPNDNKESFLKNLFSKMEQFYSGMLSVSDLKEKNYFTLEIANPNESHEFIFYVSVPDGKKELFLKQAHSIFPEAKIVEQTNDYNVFAEQSKVVASVMKFKKSPAFSLKTYDKFDFDPLNVILNAFSKMRKDGEGAAIQVIVSPAGETYVNRYKKALEDIKAGISPDVALDVPENIMEHLSFVAKEFIRLDINNKNQKTNKPLDESIIKSIEEKIGSPIVKAEFRIIVSSESLARSTDIISHLEAVFNQFEYTNGNKIVFDKISEWKIKSFVRDFSFRIFDESRSLPFSLKEISTIIHFPMVDGNSVPQLKQAKANTASAPFVSNESGIILGVNRHQGTTTKVFMSDEDRLRHFYCIGQTGTGKTTLLKNMIVQDIKNGEGVCMIDPHGSDVMDILSMIPKERHEDVIYFDPAYIERPMGLNMLEYDIRFPEQKTFVVNELFSIFKKLYGSVPESMGPAFEQYFRNTAMLVMDSPESGNTLLDIGRVLSDKAFRQMKLSKCKNPLVAQFWQNAEKTTGDQSLANFVPYITNKFDVFLQNDIMRPIVTQEKSSFNFRDIMDNKKIFLANLAKGRLGDINSNLLGLLLVGKILMAAFSRVDSVGNGLIGGLPNFYVYIDEFQNVTTDSISTILSEARKYKLSLSVAHQFIAQLDEKIKNSVFGNVGSMCAFRVGSEDGEFLEKQFAPTFTAKDLMNIENRNAYLKLLVHGSPVKPFNIETIAPEKGDMSLVEKLKELSYLKYGHPREQVEAEIMAKYNTK